MSEQNAEGWLPKGYDYERPRRGQVREGVVLKIDEQGVILDIGLKRDALVPLRDLERLGAEAAAALKPGDEVLVRIITPEDREGNLIVSLYQALSEQDWKKAEELQESGEIWTGLVSGYNRGGLLIKFGRLQGFVPMSQLWERLPRGLSAERRTERLQQYVGQELPLKVVEVNRNRRRLVLSERLAREEEERETLQNLLSELQEGEVRRGIVRSLREFGAFVDIGGAEGLIHISELSWARIGHPREVLKVGDEIDVYVLRLDHERKRIGLSLKRLQPNPWDIVDSLYFEGQIVLGKVISVLDFGAFVALDSGIEGLVHISELADPPPAHPKEVVSPGDEVVLRILQIDPHRERMGLSLKRVDEDERQAWYAEHGMVAPGNMAGEATSVAGLHTGQMETAAPEPSAKIATPGEDQAVPPFPPADEGYWQSLLEDEEARIPDQPA